MTPQQFRAARRKLGLSARAMANALGLAGPNIIFKYERGARNPSGPVRILLRIYLRYPAMLKWAPGTLDKGQNDDDR